MLGLAEKAGKNFNKVLIWCFISPFFFILMLFLELIKKYYFFNVEANRIGHLVGDSFQLIRYCEERGITPVIFLCDPPCSIGVFEFLKSQCWVVQSYSLHTAVRMLNIFNGFFLGNNRKQLYTNMDRDIYRYSEWKPFPISSVMEEAMREFRCSEGATDREIVLVYRRDPTYLKTALPLNDWAHHDYRDTGPLEYFDLSLKLIDRGYFVVAYVPFSAEGDLDPRLDRLFNEFRESPNSFFLNEAHFSYKEYRDFEFTVAACCDVMISGGGGLDSTSLVFNRPILNCNMIPLGHAYLSRSNICNLPRPIRRGGSNVFLSPLEIVESDLAFVTETMGFADKNLEPVENSSQLMLLAFLELVEEWPECEESRNLKSILERSTDSRAKMIHPVVMEGRFASCYF